MTFRQTIARLAVLVLAAVGTVAAAQDSVDTPVYPLEYRTDPVLLVASYYNAIALGDYARAYSYWESAPKNAALAEFAAGYADTEQVAAYLGVPVSEDPGAGNVFARVPTLLVAKHTDGTTHVYSGCVNTHKTNVPVGDATTPDPNWHLREAAFAEVSTFDLGLLATVCADAVPAPSPFDVINSPVNVLASYYDAIELGDYARAYSYWESAPNGASLADFAAGFADTVTADVIIRADAYMDGAAGSIYASVPVLMTATTTDNEVQHFAGCFIMRHSNVPVGDATEPSPDWRLFSADLTETNDISDGLALLNGACLSAVEG